MTDYYLSHAGKKGMKWGYTKGSPNGNRTALTPEELAKLARQTGENAASGIGTVAANTKFRYSGRLTSSREIRSSTSGRFSNTLSIGKVDLSINRGKSWLSNNANKAKSAARQTVNKGRDYVNNVMFPTKRTVVNYGTGKTTTYTVKK